MKSGMKADFVFIKPPTYEELERRLRGVEQQRVRLCADKLFRKVELAIEHLAHELKQNALLVAEKSEGRAAGDIRHIGDLLRRRTLVALFEKHLDGGVQDLFPRQSPAGLDAFFHPITSLSFLIRFTNQIIHNITRKINCFSRKKRGILRCSFNSIGAEDGKTTQTGEKNPWRRSQKKSPAATGCGRSSFYFPSTRWRIAAIWARVQSAFGVRRLSLPTRMPALTDQPIGSRAYSGISA